MRIEHKTSPRPSTLHSTTRSMNSRLPLILICISGFLMAICAALDSAVYNENGRLASGVAYLKNGDFSLFHVNPPLTSLIAAAPSLLTGAETATRSELGISPFARDELHAGIIFADKNPSYRLLLFSGRACCIIFILACFAISLKFVSSLYGREAVYFFTGIWLFSPYFLGYGHLILPDVASGQFALLSVYFFWKWMKKPLYANSFIAGIVLGLAELTKFTLLVFYPLFPLLWLMYRYPKNVKESQIQFKKQLIQFALMIIVSFAVINIGYMFDGSGKLLRTFKFQTCLFSGYKTLEEIPRSGGNRFDGTGNVIETALGFLPVPLPKDYIQGIDTQRLDFETGLPSYLRGEWSKHGWWYYYLYAILLKTPLGSLFLFLLAFFCTFFLRKFNQRMRDELVLLLPGIVLLVFVSSQTGFSVHSRYMIPALPFFFLWSCKVAKSFKPEIKTAYPKASLTVRWCAIIFLACSIVESLSIYPHSIAFFNGLSAAISTPEDINDPTPSKKALSFSQKVHLTLDAGPLNGPRHLLDSNLDWGQDLYYLERWCRKHPEVDDMVYMLWTPLNSAKTVLPPTSPLPWPSEKPRWYAISVNHLYDEHKNYRHFLSFTPEAVIGYSIYIYHVSSKEIERAKFVTDAKD